VRTSRLHTYAYLHHLRIRHANGSKFRVVCGIANCKNQYDKYASFYKHIIRKHQDLILNSVPDSLCNRTYNEPNDDIQNDDSADNDSIQTKPISIRRMQESLCTELDHYMFKYSLKLRKKFLLPASTHVEVMQECKQIVNHVLSAIYLYYLYFLAKHNDTVVILNLQLKNRFLHIFYCLFMATDI
jgi:hypothetical protein